MNGLAPDLESLKYVETNNTDFIDIGFFLSFFINLMKIS